MRLLTRISYYYFWLSVFVLGITGSMLFLFLRAEISKEIQEQLELQLDMVAQEIQQNRAVNFPLVRIDSGEKSLMQLPKIFKDTLIYDRVQKVTENYYYFTESKQIHQQYYRIKVMTTYIGWSHYSKTIIYIFACIAIMLIILGALVNYFISSKIWKPFLLNLKRMKDYSVSSKEELELGITDVREFQEMNVVLTDLAVRGKKEYTALKEFIENASHEIQTPLSILRIRLESISQLSVDEEMARLLNDAKQAIVRLNKVNKGLLLLAKLENNTFTDKQWISLDEVLKRNFELMEDLFQHKSLKVDQHIQGKKIFVSSVLMEIMVSNLLSNALSYSPPQGYISMILTDAYLEISNDGPPLTFDESKLFTRFGKGSPGHHGNGLGLSIVKQICTSHQWEIGYSYSRNRHLFRISFPAQDLTN